MAALATKFKVYGIYNILRYICIGVLILLANNTNIDETDGYKKYCCDCYYISLQPEAYDIHKNERFDLSYCIPQCTDCNYCETYYDHNATKAFLDTADSESGLCPVGDYSDTYSKLFNWHWNDATGCHSHISISSMRFLSKSYRMYGISALLISGIYAIFCTLMIVQVFRHADFSKSLFIWMCIYNVLVSEICLYLLFKPFQYFHKTISVTDENEVICEIDSIKDTTESLFNWIIWIALLFVFIHFSYMMMQICAMCVKCVRSKCNENRGRQESVNLVLNEDINEGRNYMHNYYKMTSVAAKRYCCKWSLIGAVIILTMIFFLALTVYATIVMIAAGARSDDYDAQKLAMIITATLLLFTSLIDSPWIWTKLYQKCCTKNNRRNSIDDEREDDRFD